MHIASISRRPDAGRAQTIDAATPTKRGRRLVYVLAAFAVFVVGVVQPAGSGRTPVLAASASNYEHAVLGPLYVVPPDGGGKTEWTDFTRRLSYLKANEHVTTIETDMWWGEFQKVESTFDWTYYRKLAGAIRDAGLRWIPILSFHQCGRSGSPGDDDDAVNGCVRGQAGGIIPLPSWVKNKLSQSGVDGTYQDQNGYVYDGYIAPWADSAAIPLYENAMRSFAQNFQDFAPIISSIHVGVGPSGELRYPSYIGYAGWKFPEIGFIEAYSNGAVQNFRSWAQAKYTTIGELNTWWGTSYTSFSQVRPPARSCPPPAGEPACVDQMYYSDSWAGTLGTYKGDFWNWYSGLQTEHLGAVFAAAHRALNVAAPSGFGPAMRLAGKMAGIHWHRTDVKGDLWGAEWNAGYYAGPLWYLTWPTMYTGYARAFKQANADLVTTAIELAPSTEAGAFSDPQGLVEDVVKSAKAAGVRFFGENALNMAGNEAAYERATLNLYGWGFSGFSLLRMNDLVTDDGWNPGPGAPFYDDRIADTMVTTTFSVQVPRGIVPTGGSVCLTGGSAGYASGHGPRMELGGWQTRFCTKGFLVSTDAAGNSVFNVVLPMPQGRTFDFKFRVVPRGASVPTNDTSGWEGGMFNHNCTVPMGGGACGSRVNWQL